MKKTPVPAPKQAGIKGFVEENRTPDSAFDDAQDRSFDIIVENTSPGADPIAASEKVQPWIEAGATWWIESMWAEQDPEKWRERLRQGPPN